MANLLDLNGQDISVGLTYVQAVDVNFEKEAEGTGFNASTSAFDLSGRATLLFADSLGKLKTFSIGVRTTKSISSGTTLVDVNTELRFDEVKFRNSYLIGFGFGRYYEIDNTPISIQLLNSFLLRTYTFGSNEFEQTYVDDILVQDDESSSEYPQVYGLAYEIQYGVFWTKNNWSMGPSFVLNAELTYRNGQDKATWIDRDVISGDYSESIGGQSINALYLRLYPKVYYTIRYQIK